MYTAKSLGPLEYYLRNDCKYDCKGRLCVSCKIFITKAISRVEKIFRNLPKYCSPLVYSDYSKEDNTLLLNNNYYWKY